MATALPPPLLEAAAAAEVAAAAAAAVNVPVKMAVAVKEKDQKVNAKHPWPIYCSTMVPPNVTFPPQVARKEVETPRDLISPLKEELFPV